MLKPEEWSDERGSGQPSPQRARRPSYLAIARRAPVTASLIALAVAVTLADNFGYDVSFLYLDARGLRTEPWRIVSSVLPHVGLLHLVFNCLWTWQVGIFVEFRLGSVRAFLAYLFIAFVSGLAEHTFGSIGVGLSGVVYGAVTLLWLLERRDPSRGVTITRNTLLLLGGWFFLCIGLTYFDVLPIANYAHGFGAVAGFFVGWMWSTVGRRRALVPVALIVGGAFFALARWGQPYVNMSAEGWRTEAVPAVALDEAGSCEDAIPYYERAIVLDPEQSVLYARLGACYEDLGMQAEARDVFQRQLDSELGTLDFGN